MLVVAVFAVIGLVASIFAIQKRNFLFAIGGSISWFFLIAYTRVQPMPAVVLGSNVDSLFIGICIAFSIGTILAIFVLNSNDHKKETPPTDDHEANRHNARGSSYESPEAYQARLYAITHQKRK
jgi:hypothetical protein